MDIYSLKKIETARLILRPILMGDELEINEAINCSLESLQRWMPWSQDHSFVATHAFVLKSVLSWSERTAKDYPLVLVHKLDQKIIGVSGFNEKSIPSEGLYEIGYWIDREYSGKGFVTEAVNALTRYAFDVLQASQVQICTQIDNEKSIAVVKRLGFEVKEIRKNDRRDCTTGQLADSIIFIANKSLLPLLNVTWI